MVITKVEIQNFRNIENAAYDLSERSAIEGKNYIGKTNTLQSIHWVLAGYLIDGSSDFDSMLPIRDKKLTTRVRIELDDGSQKHYVEKRYKEVWVTNRGTGKSELSSHATIYEIDGIIYDKKPTDGFKKVRELLAGNEEERKRLTNYSVDLFRVLSNPKYITEQLEWKQLRQFIVSLVGDVKDDDVFNACPRLSLIRNDLEYRHGRTDELMKYYKDQLGNLIASQQAQDNIIAVYSRKEKPSDIAVDVAEATNHQYEEDLAALKNSNASNPELELLKKEKSNLLLKISEANAKAIRTDADYAKEYQETINAIQTNINTKNQKLSVAKINLSNLENDYKKLKEEIDFANMKQSDLNDTLINMREQMKAERKATFSFTEIKCPNCGCVLNQEDEDKARVEWESGHNAKLLDISNKGKKQAKEVENGEQRIKELNDRLLSMDYEHESKKLTEEMIRLSNEIKELQESRAKVKKKTAPNEEVDELNLKYEEVNTKIANINGNNYASQEKLIQEYMEHNKPSIEAAKNTINQLAIYNDAVKNIEEANEEKLRLGKDIMDFDQKKALLDTFIVTKLSMINESTRKVFPDVEFRLVEKNIKEGSYNEVCYPLIKGKKTPYYDGSGAEKIITSVAIAEDIRKYLEIKPMPMVFDLGEGLDKDSIKALDTECQIVTAIVNSNYDVPTVVQL